MEWSTIIGGIVLLALVVGLFIYAQRHHKHNAHFFEYLSGTILSGRLYNLIAILEAYRDSIVNQEDFLVFENSIQSLNTSNLLETFQTLIKQNGLSRWSSDRIKEAIEHLELLQQAIAANDNKNSSAFLEHIDKAKHALERVRNHVTY